MAPGLAVLDRLDGRSRGVDFYLELLTHHQSTTSN